MEFGRVPRIHFPFESQETVFGKRTVLCGVLPIPLSEVPILIMKFEDSSAHGPKVSNALAMKT